MRAVCSENRQACNIMLHTYFVNLLIALILWVQLERRSDEPQRRSVFFQLMRLQIRLTSHETHPFLLEVNQLLGVILSWAPYRGFILFVQENGLIVPESVWDWAVCRGGSVLLAVLRPHYSTVISTSLFLHSSTQPNGCVLHWFVLKTSALWCSWITHKVPLFNSSKWTALPENLIWINTSECTLHIGCVREMHVCIPLECFCAVYTTPNKTDFKRTEHFFTTIVAGQNVSEVGFYVIF